MLLILLSIFLLEAVETARAMLSPEDPIEVINYENKTPFLSTESIMDNNINMNHNALSANTQASGVSSSSTHSVTSTATENSVIFGDLEGCSVTSETSKKKEPVKVTLSPTKTIELTSSKNLQEYEDVRKKALDHVVTRQIADALDNTESRQKERDECQKRLDVALQKINEDFPNGTVSLNDWLAGSTEKRAKALHPDFVFYNLSAEQKIAYQQQLAELHCLKESLDIFNVSLDYRSHFREGLTSPRSNTLWMHIYYTKKIDNINKNIAQLEQMAAEVEALIPELQHCYNTVVRPEELQTYQQNPLAKKRDQMAINKFLNAINEYEKAIDFIKYGKLKEAHQARNNAHVERAFAWGNRAAGGRYFLETNNHQMVLEGAKDCYFNEAQAIMHNNNHLARLWHQAALYHMEQVEATRNTAGIVASWFLWELAVIDSLCAAASTKPNNTFVDCEKWNRFTSQEALVYHEKVAPFYTRMAECYAQAARAATAGVAKYPNIDEIKKHWINAVKYFSDARLSAVASGPVNPAQILLFESAANAYQELAKEEMLDPNSEKIPALLEEALAEEAKLLIL